MHKHHKSIKKDDRLSALILIAPSLQYTYLVKKKTTVSLIIITMIIIIIIIIIIMHIIIMHIIIMHIIMHLLVKIRIENVTATNYLMYSYYLKRSPC